MADVPISMSVLDDFFEDFPLRQRKPEFKDVARPTDDQVEPMDISGATFLAQALLTQPGNTKAITLTFTVTINPGDGITLSLPNDAIKKLGGASGRYFVQMTRDGIRHRLWVGPISIKTQVGA